jgi:hypothetical protein
MARLSLFTNRKLPRLARAAGVRIAEALGLLEFLWHAQHEACDETIGDALDVETLARWEGEPGKLVAALVEARFVDVREDGVHVVHDFWDHAPDFVRKRREREDARRARGLTLSEVRAAAGRRGAEAVRASRQVSGKRPATDRQIALTREDRREEKSESVGRSRDTRALASLSEGRAPTVEAWTALARERFPDWPEEDVRSAFTFASSEGKLHARGWEAMLSRLHAAHLRHVATSKAKLSPAERERIATRETIARARGGASS